MVSHYKHESMISLQYQLPVSKRDRLAPKSALSGKSSTNLLTMMQTVKYDANHPQTC